MGQFFQVLMLCLQKTVIWLALPDKNSFDVFFLVLNRSFLCSSNGTK